MEDLYVIVSMRHFYNYYLAVKHTESFLYRQHACTVFCYNEM